MKAEHAADDRDSTTSHHSRSNNNTPNPITTTTTTNHPYTTTTPTPILPPPTCSNINNMFSAFHQQPSKSQPLPQLPFHHPQFLQHHHHFSLDPPQHPNPNPHQQSQTSSETDSPTQTPTPSTTTPPPSKKPKQHGTTPTTTATTELDGATIEVVRRPRGRPPGSKNKPKPPVIITKEPESPSMSPYILEIPSNSDIIDSLTRFTHRRNINICILTGSGSVTNITLKQPSNGTATSTVTFHGRFDILSISAVLMCGTTTFFGGGGGGGGNDNGLFSISLAGPQGQIVGGKVVGSLIASGTVFVIAAGFGNPSYHRLVNTGDEDEVQHVSGSGSQHGGLQQQSGNSPGGSGSGGGEGGGGVQQGGIGLYSCHLGSDIIWAPAVARPVPQHPHPQQQPPY